MRVPHFGTHRRSVLRLTFVALLAAAALAPASAAARSSTPLNPCGQALSQPFLPWLDAAGYALIPGGAFEGSANGWALSGGAKLVAGNEPFFVHGPGDQKSLLLAAGGSATSLNVCMGLLSPTTRFFVRNTGAPLGRLRVDAVYKDLFGLKHSDQIALVASGSSWQPTLPILVLANLTALPVVTNGTVQVAFRLTPVGLGAAFQVDDDYVDPYQGR
jgi:hypothetical protein